MKFIDVPTGSMLRFIKCSDHVYHKFAPGWVSYVRHGEVKRAFIKPNTEVQEVIEADDPILHK